jgi:propionyl-CoA carboxylase beta chain
MIKLTAYQRIELLADAGTFEEIGNTANHPGQKKESIITGLIKLNNRPVALIASDITCKGGSIGETAARKINHLLDLAIQNRIPVVALFESPGARIQEGVTAMHHVGEVFRKMGEISGALPTVAVLFGVNSGATAYTAALMDFIIMVEVTSCAFITGPKVIGAMIGEVITQEALGGTLVHGTQTGLATCIAAHEAEAIQKVKSVLSYLPQHCFESPQTIQLHTPKKHSSPDILSIIPADNEKQGYDMHHIINELVDDDSFLELYAAFAPNLLTGFARLGNMPLGIVANQPMCMSGILDVESCKKSFRFIQLCDAYQIPLLFIADSPGFMPGMQQEHAAMLGLGARVLNVLANSTIPKITLLVNKIIGGAYGGMSSKGLGADLVFAWPTAQISILGTEAALRIIYQKEMENAADQRAFKAEKRKEFSEFFLSPYAAAAHGQVDAVIRPESTRSVLLKAFSTLQNKSVKPVKKRRNILPMG